MSVGVVTDSTSDIPRDMAREMNISVVPVYVIFGRETYRDRVDIFEDEFYRRLIDGRVHPTTSVPSPQDFASVYDNLAEDTSEVVSIHVSSKPSGTYESAVLGARLVSKKCRVEVLDSMSMGMASRQISWRNCRSSYLWPTGRRIRFRSLRRRWLLLSGGGR